MSRLINIYNLRHQKSIYWEWHQKWLTKCTSVGPLGLIVQFRHPFDAATYEPRHDKTNKRSVRPAKTQISLGIRPVW